MNALSLIVGNDYSIIVFMQIFLGNMLFRMEPTLEAANEETRH